MAVQGCTCEWRQGSEWGYWHAPCEALQNPCGPRRARRPAPPSVTPAWIRCPPAGAHHAVRWRSCEAGTLPSAAHQIHTAVHTVLRRHGTRHGATASDTVLAPARRDPVVGRRGRNEFALATSYPRFIPPQRSAVAGFFNTRFPPASPPSSVSAQRATAGSPNRRVLPAPPDAGDAPPPVAAGNSQKSRTRTPDCPDIRQADIA